MDEQTERVCELVARWISEVYPLVCQKSQITGNLETTTSSVADFRKSMAIPLERAHRSEVTHSITKHGKPYASIIGLIGYEILNRTDALGQEYSGIMGISVDKGCKEFNDLILGVLTAMSLKHRGIQPTF